MRVVSVVGERPQFDKLAPVHAKSVDLAEPHSSATQPWPPDTDPPVRGEEVLTVCDVLPAQVVVVAHSRVRVRVRSAGLTLGDFGLHVLEPLVYGEPTASLRMSTGVTTNPRGLQNDWVVTTSAGWNVVNEDAHHLPDNVMRGRPSAPVEQVFVGTGNTAERAIEAMHGSTTRTTVRAHGT